MVQTIKEFQGQYRFLSNFHPSPVIINVGGTCMTFPTVEHYYQSMKATNEKDREMIMNARTPGEAKRLGRKIKTRNDWQEIRIYVMKTGLEAKFSQNDDLRVKLLGTGDAILEEGNKWGDTFWGVDLATGKGENRLGKILMDVREKLKAEQ